MKSYNTSFLKKYINIISSWLVALSAASFLLLYFVLGFFNRPASDDIIFISIIKGKNIVEYIKWFYETWSGRWTGNAYFFAVMSASNAFQNIHYFMLIYYIITLILFIYSISTIIKIGAYKLFLVQLEVKQVIIYSVLFLGSFYFLTFQYIEVWWWMCASVDTLQGIVFLLLGTALLLKENKKFIHYIFISFAFIYVGGGFEIYSIITIAIFIFILIYYLFQRDRAFFSFSNNSLLKGLSIAILSFIISFSVSIISPGNKARRNSVLDENKIESNGLSISNVGPLLNAAVFTQKKFIAGIGFAALWMLLGMQLSNKSNVVLDKSKMKYLLRLSALVMLFSILITLAFQYFILDNSFIPSRGWTFTSFAIAVFLCLLFLFIGCYANSSSYISQATKIVLPSIMMIVLVFTLYKQYNYVSKYASEYDTLIAELMEKQKSGNTGTIYVNNLPDSGMLLSIDISDSTNTIPIKEILDLKYDIVVKK